jgi:hypothetical protein
VAGDATGIILAAVITATLGLPMWLDLIVEYIAGFLFGLLIFQSLFMKSMMGGTYRENVRRSFMPEFISMNAMMAGMAPVMSLLMMGRDMRAMEPTEMIFWGVMSLGVIAGYAVAYPVNVWMVARKMKHGLMTLRPGKSHEHHPGMNHEHHPVMNPEVTRPQLLSVTFITLLMLAAGMMLPALKVNMRLSAKDVGGAIMPPGMIMGWDTPGGAMRDMSAVLPKYVTHAAGVGERGDRTLEPRLEGGVKVFDLTASVIRWNILPDVAVEAYAYNGQVPGPRIRVTEGDRVRMRVKNDLPEPTTVHWHGLILPNEMDGRPTSRNRRFHPAANTPTNSPRNRRALSSITRMPTRTGSRRSDSTAR